MLVIGSLVVALAGCGGSVSVTQNGGGAQSGTNAPSGTGNGNVTNPPAQAQG